MSANVIAAPEWLYFKIYVGEAIGGMDYLITNAFPEALHSGNFKHWFYIRYADQGGFHLRARFLPHEFSPETQPRLQRLFENALKTLPRVAGLEYRPMVIPDHVNGIESPTTTRAFVEPAAYERENHKFGGPQGVEIAESLFQASSNLAIAILNDEFAGRYSRKLAAPCLMNAVFSAFPPGSAERSFWKSYCLYWLGGASVVAEEWRGRFLSKGSSLASSGKRIVASPETVPVQLTEHLKRWDDELAKCALRYAESKQHTATEAMLCFQFVHLMNNRLGLNVLEEAYLATLLENSAEQRVAA